MRGLIPKRKTREELEDANRKLLAKHEALLRAWKTASTQRNEATERQDIAGTTGHLQPTA
ncbi:hypothetical protein [Roseixanthobacter liquoris]|uniref:hypothetical protein n=1 Tax=Roseixanthobacter liquoris TaxID=3119921 RepID=UPI00372979E1